ncbi:hypothetical protein ACLB2K_047361 [Fragaria x ananassa]
MKANTTHQTHLPSTGHRRLATKALMGIRTPDLLVREDSAFHPTVSPVIMSILIDMSRTGSDECDSSGRDNIGGVFVAEDISRTGSDECDSSGRDNIGGVSVAEDCSSTGSSIGIQYVDQVSVDQVPPDIASFEAVIRNSVCSVVVTGYRGKSGDRNPAVGEIPVTGIRRPVTGVRGPAKSFHVEEVGVK